MSPRRSRSLPRRLAHGLRRRLGPPLAALGTALVPALYVSYVRLVFATSRVRFGGLARVSDAIEQRDGAIALLWHEEVFFVPWAYPFANLRPYTLASTGRSGELITRILERCGYSVFRGGTSEKRRRRRPMVVRDMLELLRSRRRVVIGITVDGSKGPAYRLKPGGIAIARLSGRPLLLVRVWARRCLRLPTWDRTAIPLPWNEIRYSLRGPFFPPDDGGEAALRRFTLELEDELVDLAIESYRAAGQPVPEQLARRSAEEREAFLEAARR